MTPLTIVVYIIKLILGILLSCFSIYLGLRFFDKLTAKIDEVKELKKGNVAIAILIFFLIISVGIMLKGVIGNIIEFFSKISTPVELVVGIIMSVVQLVVGIIIITISMYIGIKVYDSLTPTIDEIQELKKGNVAIAIIIGSVILVISLIVSDVITSIVKLEILNPSFVLKLLKI